MSALARATDMVGYWAGLLVRGLSHPRPSARASSWWGVRGDETETPLSACMAPSSPALMPPIPSQDSSFPGRHATELSVVIADGTGDARNVSAKCPANPNAPRRSHNTKCGMLDRLERVARNREVMGLHYRSDSGAGESVAAAITPEATGVRFHDDIRGLR
jgi:hypothetical protein